MNVTQLPFNQLLGLQKCQNQDDGILELPADPKYLNHVDTVHATAIYGLAEASSGQFLSDNIKVSKHSIVPILRRAEIKYRKPGMGSLFSRGVYNAEDWDQFHATYADRKRALLSFPIEILDEENAIIALAQYEWFIAEKPKDDE